MGEVSYRPLIEDMVWSYSRLKNYENCRYAWFLKYIRDAGKEDKFYSSYGSFMHKLIEDFYKGNLTKEEMLHKFLSDFSEEVRGERPPGDLSAKYVQYGIEYMKGFELFRFHMIAVEKDVEFKIGDIPFVGFLDYLGEEDGEYVIVDHKSRNLMPRSRHKKPTLKDQELDNMLRQLYLYSAAVKEEYGKFPKLLCFNCFKNGVFIEEPFRVEAYEEAVEWAEKTVEEIKDTEEFFPYVDYFGCKYICDVSNECCYCEQRQR